MLTLNVIGYNPPVSNVSIRGGGRGRELVVLFSVRASKNSKKLLGNHIILISGVDSFEAMITHEE